MCCLHHPKSPSGHFGVLFRKGNKQLTKGNWQMPQYKEESKLKTEFKRIVKIMYICINLKLKIKSMKKYWWIVFIALTIPIALNFALRIRFPLSVIGDEELWLTFWGSYGGAVVGSIITLFVLYKTLSQNEKNNTATKDQQIRIIKAQFRQKWLDDLTPILIRNNSYIKIIELNIAVTYIVTDIDRAEKFFNNEISLCESEPLALTFHFSTRSIESNVEGNQSENYIKNFDTIHTQYLGFLVFCGRIILLKRNSGTIEDAKKCLTWVIEDNKNSNLSSVEIQTLEDALSKSITEFVTKLYDIMNKRFDELNDFLNTKGSELREEAHKLVAYEKEKIMTEIK